MQALLMPVITVDGPSGSGKGTVCRLLADKLGWDWHRDANRVIPTVRHGRRQGVEKIQGHVTSRELHTHWPEHIR